MILVLIPTILLSFNLQRSFDIKFSDIAITLILPMGFLIIALFISVFFAIRNCVNEVINYLNNIDIDDIEKLEKNSIYEELYPLIKKIKKQEKKIQTQIETITHKQEEFTALTKNMKEGFLVLDNKGKILFNNKSATELLSIKDREYLGEDIITVDRRGIFSESVKKAIVGESTTEMFEKNAGFYRFTTNPVVIDGDVAGVVLLLMDVTEQHNHEQLRREFTANVSHELKTPLTSISGYAELISSGIAKEEDILSFSKRIYNETQRMIELVRDLLLLSQLDEKDKSLEKKSCNLLDLAYEVSDNLKEKADKNRIDILIKNKESKEEYRINGVATVLYEMIYNLVENGIKYNREDGKVIIEIQKTEQLILRVSDTGIGIPISEQERVFERFYRVDKSRNKSVSGTGMGLAIVKNGVGLHDGTVFLESTINVGTAITIKFNL